MTAAGDLIWNGREDDDLARAKIRHAICQSELSTSRIQGMKIRAREQPPRAAKGGFPYSARTCAEWVMREDIGRCPVKRRGHVG